ncbi:MAG: hypothetical protein R6U40_03640, partial [Desulfobacterales bacterium]
HVEHEAIVALDLTRPDVPGIGVARYIRDAFERHVAEAAIYQHNGSRVFWQASDPVSCHLNHNPC